MRRITNINTEFTQGVLITEGMLDHTCTLVRVTNVEHQLIPSIIILINTWWTSQSILGWHLIKFSIYRYTWLTLDQCLIDAWLTLRQYHLTQIYQSLLDACSWKVVDSWLTVDRDVIRVSIKWRYCMSIEYWLTINQVYRSTLHWPWCLYLLHMIWNVS